MRVMSLRRALLPVVCAVSAFFAESCLPTEPAEATGGSGNVREVVAEPVCPEWPATLADGEDPLYRIVKPLPGEIFHVGEQCTVVVIAERDGEAELRINFGRYSFLLPGRGGGTVNPRLDSVTVFIIPAGFEDVVGADREGNLITEQVGPLSEQCYISVVDYNMPGEYVGFSECYFSIRP